MQCQQYIMSTIYNEVITILKELKQDKGKIELPGNLSIGWEGYCYEVKILEYVLERMFGIEEKEVSK